MPLFIQALLKLTLAYLTSCLGLVLICLVAGIGEFGPASLFKGGLAVCYVMFVGRQLRWTSFQDGATWVAVALSVIGLFLPIPALSCLGLAMIFDHGSRLLKHSLSNLLQHLQKTTLLFALADVFVVSNGTLMASLDTYSERVTSLIRNSFGAGNIVGAEMFGLRLLILFVVASIPWRIGRQHSKLWHTFGIQCTLLILAMPLRATAYELFPIVLFFGFAAFAVVLNAGAVNRRSGEQRWPVMHTVLLCMLFIFSLAGFGSTSKIFQAEVLFVEDGPRSSGEYPAIDMASFQSMHTFDNYEEFIEESKLPNYGTIFHKLLPSLGFSTRRVSVSKCRREDFLKSDIVVLICHQNGLSDSQRNDLLDAVERGQTNVLIVGDHTDIGGVQRPFNAFMSDLGVTLKYDSAMPTKAWVGQLRYFAHPINGVLAFINPRRASSFGVSVGASLNIDRNVAYPVVSSINGYSDAGTPNAPQVSGLGDMMYTINETRGGQVLIAERPFGRGTIVASGDTAFLQNGSCSTHYDYISSLFGYLGRSNPSVTIRYFRLGYTASGLLLMALLWISFRQSVAVVSVLVLMASHLIAAEYSSPDLVANKLRGKIVVVDNSHKPSFKTGPNGAEVYGMIDLVNSACPSALVVESNAANLLRRKASERDVVGVVMIGQQAGYSTDDYNRLTEFVSSGGKLLIASGFFDARSHVSLFEEFGFTVSPVALGSIQGLKSSEQPGLVPTLVECWALDLDDSWLTVLSAFKQPVIACRSHQKGKVAVISDSFALLDETIQNAQTHKVREAAFNFYRPFFENFFQE